jgi:integrase
VKPFKLNGGHRPWTDDQIKVAHEHLTGMVRRGVLLQLFTGQRGSDVVRLGPTMIDDGGFDLGWRGQIKTGERPWCPILPELAREMETWEKRAGPFLLTERGKPFTRRYFADQFVEQKRALAKQGITVLEGTTLHGLRATACVRLKRAGLSDTMIGDIVGMSVEMVERYTRFENKRESGKAALILIAERRAKAAGRGE